MLNRNIRLWDLNILSGSELHFWVWCCCCCSWYHWFL